MKVFEQLSALTLLESISIDLRDHEDSKSLPVLSLQLIKLTRLTKFKLKCVFNPSLIIVIACMPRTVTKFILIVNEGDTDAKLHEEVMRK